MESLVKALEKVKSYEKPVVLTFIPQRVRDLSLRSRIRKAGTGICPSIWKREKPEKNTIFPGRISENLQQNFCWRK